MKKGRTIAFVSAFTICAVAAFIGPESGSALNGPGVCPIVTGAEWTLPAAPYTTGTRYDLHVHGKITCRQAAGYVKTLVQRSVQTNKPFAGGPRGWTCKASASKTGRAYTGTCQPKSESFLPRDYFVWTVG